MAETLERQHRIQDQVADTDRKKPKSESSGAMQAGARDYPVPPFPKQHQPKPGDESALRPEPLYEAPYYIGSKKLKGKVAIITGADSGIGRSVAILFAREGADIAAVYLSEHKDAKVTKKNVEAEGRRCHLIAGDVTDPAFCDKAVMEAVKKLGKIDILVNNAAFQVHSARIEDLTAGHFDETIHTNLYGYFFMAKAAVQYLQRGSAIINTGSVTAMHGSPSLLDYSITKGGIHAFTKSLAGQLVSRGIRVNCVAPGPVWTPLNPSDKEDVSEFGSKTKMKRPAQPEEIAPAYVFLASPQCSSYITGEILPITGGGEG